ncbi:hypothetical protein Sjap_012652 [Stephania japonica]|uniref:Transducin/WD40 repeat-like superfamily protein n=1 Tax=Stephania japonica TaxID=461633 RepID=A0AAP0IX63_9MAGN
MDRFVVPRSSNSLIENPRKPSKRFPWKRSVVEIEGRMSSKYRRTAAAFMLESYREVGAFSHLYHIDGIECPTHMNRLTSVAGAGDSEPLRREGVSGLEFDNKGIYLASVTKSGCLTVHDFEALYCLCNSSLGRSDIDDERKHLMHISVRPQLDVVRWNLANQDEVACTSMITNEVHIFDIGLISTKPITVLRKRPAVTVHGCEGPRGLTDIAFISSDKSRLLASDVYGVINIWDRRARNVPCAELISNSNIALSSIQVDVENQFVFGASKHGNIYAWDLRGGRTSLAFHKEKSMGSESVGAPRTHMNHPPLATVKVASLLEKIESLKEQTDIFSKEIHSINLNPSCPYQLAFHLEDGWSGVLDINSWQVTHIHCPPPAWLKDIKLSHSPLRKLSENYSFQIYAVGSSSTNGIHLLDFYPDPTSACHVDNDDKQSNPEEKHRNIQNKFVSSSEGVTVCASHPLNGTIIAGTKRHSLLVMSELCYSYNAEQYIPTEE